MCLVGACTGGPEPGATFDPRYGFRAGCGLGRTPDLAEAVDAGSLEEWISERTTLAGTDAVVVFSVWRRGGEGEEREPRIRILESGLEPDATAALADAVRSRIPPSRSADREEGWQQNYRLRIRPGTDPVVEAGPSLECPPRLANPESIQQEVIRVGRAIGIEGTAVLWLEVSASGRVSEVQVHVGSGSSVLDDALARVGERMRFDPGAIDGFPFLVWVEMPLTVRIPRE